MRLPISLAQKNLFLNKERKENVFQSILFFSEKPHLVELAASTWVGENDLSGRCGIY